MTLHVPAATPHLFPAALCAGIAGALVVREPSASVLVAAALVGVAAVLAPPRSRVPTVAAALLLVGLWWGSVRLESLERSVLAEREGRAAPATVVVTAPARQGRFDLRVFAHVERFGQARVGEPVLLRLPLGRAPPQGARLELIGRVTAPRGPDRGFDERTWLARRGIHVVIRASSWRPIGRRGGVGGFADRLRAQIAATMAPGLAGERRAIVAGVVLGEDEALSEELREAFRASGLFHLLAVSGQNVALIAGGVLALAWLLSVPRWAGEIAVLAAIVGYVLAVGWQPSVVRAGVAGCLASLAWLAARPRDRWYFLLLGALVLLAWSPYSLLDPGFQLSFAAVSAIFVAVPRLGRGLEGYPVPRALADVVAVSAGCGIATAPILWWHFGAVPLFTVVSNALAVPAVAPLLGLGLLAAAVAPVAPAAAVGLAWLNGWFAAYLATCARVVAALPFAQLTSGTAVAVVTVALAGAAAAARARGRLRRQIVAVLVGGIALLGGWQFVPDAGRAPPQGLRVTFLDVGQGDAVLLETRAGAVLVDQGVPEAKVWTQLRRLGVRRLSMLVLTHPERDHVGGAADVLRHIAVETVLDTGAPSPGPDGTAARSEARRQRVPIVHARAGASYRLGALRLRVLWPRRPGREGENANDWAIVLLATYGETDVLLTADAEGHVTTPLRPPPVEILKVAHHGSSDPYLARLLALTRPRIAVICVGRNSYGHPAPSTLADLEAVPNLALYRTDRDGRVTIETDGKRILVADER
jgi:competence protein ComEC